MTLRRKLLLVNAGGVLGTGVSFFIVPEQTQTWLILLIAAVVMSILNLLVLNQHQQSLADGSSQNRNGIGGLLVVLILLALAVAIKNFTP